MLLKIYNNLLTPKDMDMVVRTFRVGGIIIYPTDSVYAFGCDANNRKAVERICMLRNKDLKHPMLSIVCGNIAQIREYTLFSDDTYKILKQYLPGPYTFILEGNSRLPKLFRNNRKTVGVRIPNHPVPMQIIENYGTPLMTASLRADLSDDIEYMTDPELMEEKYGDTVDIIIDAGIGNITPSTIIDCTGDEPELVRQGMGQL